MARLLFLSVMFFSHLVLALQAEKIGNLGDTAYLDGSDKYIYTSPRDKAGNIQISFSSLAEGKLVFQDIATDLTHGPFLHVEFIDDLNVAIAFFDSEPYVPNFIRIYKLHDNLQDGATRDLPDIKGADSAAVDSKRGLIYVRRPASALLSVFDVRNSHLENIKYDVKNEVLVFAGEDLLRLVRTSTNPEKYSVFRVNDSKSIGSLTRPQSSQTSRLNPWIGGQQSFELIEGRYLLVHERNDDFWVEDIFDLQQGISIRGETYLAAVKRSGPTRHFWGGSQTIYNLDATQGLKPVFQLRAGLVTSLIETNTNLIVGWDGSSGQLFTHSLINSIQPIGQPSGQPSEQLKIDCTGAAALSSNGHYLECLTNPRGVWWKLQY
jgi:hypothetical protein